MYLKPNKPSYFFAALLSPVLNGTVHHPSSAAVIKSQLTSRKIPREKFSGRLIIEAWPAG